MNEDKASRYHRLKRASRVAYAVAAVCILVSLLISGASAAWRDVCAELASAVAPAGLTHRVVTGLVYAASLALFVELLLLPLVWYQLHHLEVRYGVSTLTTRAWLVEHAKGGGVALVLALGVVAVVVVATGWSSVWWWVPSAGVLGAASIGLTWLAPVLIFPLFFRFRPLNRVELAARLADLAQRAGANVVGAYEWTLGDRTRAANAALVGMGATRRILVSDTLLAHYSDDEVEVILAHELAHHVHGDLWRMLRVDAMLTVGALAAAHAAALLVAGRFGLRGVADVAALPALLLGAGAFSLATIPWVNAVSRTHERRADRFALDLTGNPDAFVSAMRRLGAQNLADDDPSPLVEAVFHSHPPLSKRIAAARAWPGRATVNSPE